MRNERIEAKVIRPEKIVFDFEVIKFTSKELAKELNEAGKFIELSNGIIIYVPEPHTWFSMSLIDGYYDEKEKALIISDEIPPGILPCNTAKYAIRIAKALYRRVKEIARTFEELKKRGRNEETREEVGKLIDEIWTLLYVTYSLVGTALSMRNTPIPPSFSDLESAYAKELGLSLKKMIEFAERPVSPSCNNNYTNVAKLAYKAYMKAADLYWKMTRFRRH